MRRKRKLPVHSEKALLLGMMYYLDANYHEMEQRNRETTKEADTQAGRQEPTEKERKLQAYGEELTAIILEIEKEKEEIRNLQKETQMEVQRYTVDVQQLLHAVVGARDAAQTLSKYSPNQNVIYTATFVNQRIPPKQIAHSYKNLLEALKKARATMGVPDSRSEAE